METDTYFFVLFFVLLTGANAAVMYVMIRLAIVHALAQRDRATSSRAADV